jgi:hypothetical protein
MREARGEVTISTNSPWPALSAVKELLAQGVLEQDFFDENVAIRIPIKEYREAQAVLDSLDNIIIRLVAVAEAAKRLLVTAEAEVGEKDNTPEGMRGGAEFWAAQDNIKYQVPGVARRIEMARRVLEMREALAALREATTG